jgi:hypothetical protein
MSVVPDESALRECCASFLALSLDIRFLLDRCAGEPLEIWPEGASLETMPMRTGGQVADELAGRMLVRYVTEQHPPPASEAWLTPTPLGARGAGTILHLPHQVTTRHWVLVIDPARVGVIQGPRRVTMGQGIEYYLPHGYDAGAVLEPGYGVRVL